MKKGLLLLAILFVFSVNAQKLSFKIENQKDTIVYLIKRQGVKLMYADTAELKNGRVEFDGSKQFPGMLGVLLPGQKYFEFIYNNEDIKLQASLPDLVGSLKVIKSEENKIFRAFIKFITNNRRIVNEISQKQSILSKTDPKYQNLSEDIEKINMDVMSYRDSIIEMHKGKLVSKIIKMSVDIKVPDSPMDENGNIIDSNFTYKYMLNHYWDNVDLTDDALINFELFEKKIEFYFNRMIPQQTDSIISHAFILCDKLLPKSKMFEFCVTWITSTYSKSKIMGMDKVYLYMLNRYYCTKNAQGESPAFWMSADKLEGLCEDLEYKIKLTVGSVPPNLILRDTTDQNWRDFYSLDAEYTVLYFWDPDCGHCKKTTPKLETLYQKKFRDRNVEIFAVGKAIGEDFEKWKKFIRDNHLSFINVGLTDNLFNDAQDTTNRQEKLMKLLETTTLGSLNYQKTYDIFSTPKVFLLDKDKKIIANRIGISQLEELVDIFQGMEDLPKLFPPDPEEDAQMQKKE
jgi:thiol-disulfide isomerase/thioredoxin